MAIEAARMRDGPPATDLVSRATGGDKQAWDALVERYIPLVWSICRRHQLDNADAREVSQTVWRQLASRLGTLRDPAALAGWLATTTQRECDLIRRAARRPCPGRMPEAASTPGERTPMAEQELLTAERHAVLREAFALLPPHCQRLIALLVQDPPAPDAEIGAELGIPARSIRQSCRSCLQRLRSHPAVTALIDAEANGGTETSGQAVALP